MRIGPWLLKAAAIWIALLLGTMLGAGVAGLAGGPATSPTAPDGPLSAGGAFLAVAGMHALVLALIAAQTRSGGWTLMLVLFATLFGAQTVLMQIETLFFSAHVRIPPDLLARIVASAAISTAIGAGVAAWLFRAEPGAPTRIDGLHWRLAVLAGAYLGLYFAAGYLIAWQFPALRSYYGDGFQIALWPLIALQLLRGLIWAGLAVLLARHLSGSRPMRALTLALAFAVFGAAQLLYPNAWMPWPVRLPHLVEIGLANALFGAVAALVLWPRAASGPVRDARPDALPFPS
jgi:hypothetical protein